MATITSAQAGNWSDPATWTGGVLPGAGDVASASHSVVIDQSITCTTLAGSGFVVNSSVTINANVNATNGGLPTLDIQTGGVAVLNGNVLGVFSSAQKVGVRVSGTGASLTINGTIEVSSGWPGTSLLITGPTSNVVVNGVVKSLTAFSVGTCVVEIAASAFDSILTVNATAAAPYPNGDRDDWIRLNGAGCQLNYFGDITSSPKDVMNPDGNSMLSVGANNVTIAITGNLVGGQTSAEVTLPCIYVSSGITGFNITVNGNVSGVTSSSNRKRGHAIHIPNTNNSGRITVNGNVYGTSSPAIFAPGDVPIRVTGEIFCGPNGESGIMALKLFSRVGENLKIHNRDDASWPSPGGNAVWQNFNEETPPPEDVREGVEYGEGGVLTGSLSVPPPESVLMGVPTDDVTGSFASDAETIRDVVWGATESDIAPNTLGDRLSRVATVQTTGAQIVAALTPPGE